MKNNSSAELKLHSYVLSSGTNALPLLIDAFSEHLLRFLSKHYKKNLADRMHFANEAVYATLEWYNEHPRMYNSQQGSFIKFLELRAHKNLQEIFRREGEPIHINSTDRILACYIDNEKDLALAKLAMSNEPDFSLYVQLLDIGSWRFSRQQTEVKRQKERARKIIEHIPELKTRTKKEQAVLIYLGEAGSATAAYRQTGL